MAYREYAVVLAETEDYWRAIFDSERPVVALLKAWLALREQIEPNERERFDNEALPMLITNIPRRDMPELKRRLSFCLDEIERTMSSDRESA